MLSVNLLCLQDATICGVQSKLQRQTIHSGQLLALVQLWFSGYAGATRRSGSKNAYYCVQSLVVLERSHLRSHELGARDDQ